MSKNHCYMDHEGVLRKAELIFSEIEKDLHLVDKSLIDWNINYFKGHKRRYLSDLKLLHVFFVAGQILEVGSMPFHLTAYLSKIGISVKGIDLEPERARRFIKKYNLDISKCNVDTERLPFGDDSFEVVIFNEIFEHLRINPIATLLELNRVLKPGGKLILTTPNLYAVGNIWWYLTGRSIDNSPFKEYLKLEKLGHMGHVRIYSAREVREFLFHTQFEVDKVIFRYFYKQGKISFLFNMIYMLIPNWRPQLVIVAAKKA